jgi:hypothetical protein
MCRRVARGPRRFRVPIRAQPLRRARNRDKERALCRREAGRLLAEISETCRTHPFEIAAERRQGQVEAKNLLFRQMAFERQRLSHFADLCSQRARVTVEKAHHLHCQG